MSTPKAKKAAPQPAVKKGLNIYQKLAALRDSVQSFVRDTEGYRYQYVSGSQVLSAFRPMMSELGLVLITQVTRQLVTRLEASGRDDEIKVPLVSVHAEFVFSWVNADNPLERIEIPFVGGGQDPDIAKAIGKMLTYTERYFFLKEMNVPTDDEDPDAEQGGTVTRTREAARPLKMTPIKKEAEEQETESRNPNKKGFDENGRFHDGEPMEIDWKKPDPEAFLDTFARLKTKKEVDDWLKKNKKKIESLPVAWQKAITNNANKRKDAIK